MRGLLGSFEAEEDADLGDTAGVLLCLRRPQGALEQGLHFCVVLSQGQGLGLCTTVSPGHYCELPSGEQAGPYTEFPAELREPFYS